ncbi:RING-CH-type domain-containing protein [Psidium guajava]|nr:RING-CH-type domain-containing protein [Psidium guajava]
MDQMRRDLETGGSLNQADSGTREHSEHSVDETGAVIDLEDGPMASPQAGQSETRSNDLGSSGVSIEVADNAILVHQERNDGSLEQVGDQGTSRCSEEDGVGRRSEAKGGGKSESETVLKKDLKKSVPAKGDDSYVIDIQCGNVRGGCGENGEGERVCRICHLSSEQSGDAIPGMTMGDCTTAATSSMELIQLGCGCKDELGIVHSHCAEAWFKLKGNRFCEICGETAKNISGVGDNRFMEEWNERRFTAGNISSSEREGCWRGQPFCNFLMACLVIAFVLPWFFRVNMF